MDAADGPSIDDTALRMEVDRGPGPPATADLRTQNVHVEIEQRWHQVETTPLREEKQVPIAPLHLSSSEDGSDRLSTPELTSVLEKEVMAGRRRRGSSVQPPFPAPRGLQALRQTDTRQPPSPLPAECSAGLRHAGVGGGREGTGPFRRPEEWR